MGSNVRVACAGVALMLFMALAGCAAQTVTVSAAVKEVLDKREAVVNNIAAKAKTLFYKRCDTAVRTCSACTRDVCAKDPDFAEGATCADTFGGSSICSDPKQSWVRFDGAGARMPPGATASDATVKQDVCMLQDLDGTFISNNAAATGLSWQYFGTVNGVHKQFPTRTGTFNSAAGQGCKDYDPRFRPWYIAASSGPKNVVIVLDMSGSMLNANRAELARNAAKSVVETLSQTDWVAVMSFSSEGVAAKRFPATGMLQGTAANLAKVTDYINNMSPSGGTDFNEGFKGAFAALKEATTAETRSNCVSTILFLTDGVVRAGSTVVADTMATIATENAAEKAFIFTYSLGTGADKNNMKNIACGNRGVWAHIDDGGDLRTKMAQYYQFLAQGLDNDKVVWSEEYVGASTGTNMITAARAVYDSNVQPPLLLGVAGVDVESSAIAALGNAPNTFKYLLQQSKGCASDFNLTDCEMEELRGINGDESKCGITCPVSHDRVSKCSSSITASVFCNSGTMFEDDVEDQMCCSGSSDGSTAIIIVVVVVVIVGAICGGVLFKACQSKPKAPTSSPAPAPAPAPAAYGGGAPAPGYGGAPAPAAYGGAPPAAYGAPAPAPGAPQNPYNAPPPSYTV